MGAGGLVERNAFGDDRVEFAGGEQLEELGEDLRLRRGVGVRLEADLLAVGSELEQQDR